MKVCMVILVLLIGQSLPLKAQQGVSLYADVKGHQPGDIITVIIVEASNAQRGSSKNHSSESSARLDGAVSGDVLGATPNLGISSGRRNAGSGSEETGQKEQLSGRIAVRIMEETDNGLFRIEGEREVGVNGQNSRIKLSGFVRPRDITSANTLMSYHIADARIVYERPGVTKKVGGFFSSLVTPAVWGVLLATAIGALSLGG